MLSDDDAAEKLTVLPLLPLRDEVIFPHSVKPLFVGREKSISALRAAALKRATEGRALIVLASQRKPKLNDPTPEDLFTVGTVGHIQQLLPLPDGTMKVLIEGLYRVRLKNFVPDEDYLLVEVERFVESGESSIEMDALVRAIQATFKAFVELNKKIPPEVLPLVSSIEDPLRLADTITAHLTLKLPDKQALLEMESVSKRMERLYELMQGEIEILKVEKKIRTRVKKQMERNQKEYYLNEQMQAIQKELGDKDEAKNEVQELEEKLKNKKGISTEAHAKVKKEIRKLKLMGPMSAEASVVRNYIDCVLSLPWGEETKDKLDILEAEKILNTDHFGLHKVKERILEYLAVQQLVGQLKGPILCFVGPPGVGKTSLARSIARSLDRKFVRISLGGVRDEAEIRGHRRTYIGAMPGKIIHSLRKAESSNPVMLLDEVDKMSTDFRGDPSSALLEVLDPEQNNTFSDHYLDLDYDLSKVMFVCTANSMHTIPQPLQDRMEIIRIAGYTELEKLSIAKKYLVPKQQEANGLKGVSIKLTGTALRTVINRYTYEAGVRNLEREISSLFRKVARRVVKKEVLHQTPDQPYIINRKLATKFLGVPRFEYQKRETEDQIGLVTGLAVTMAGGDTLSTEATMVPGKGVLMVTGILSDMMKESAQAALSYVRSRGRRFGIDPKIFETNDIHVHIPTAVPKDGNSAGVTIATAIMSTVTRIPVRRDVAMTGEVTLRGRVLPIGGLKEKVLAAHRAEMSVVLFPWGNRKDVKEIPKRIRDAVQLIPVRHVDEILRVALAVDKPEGLFQDGKLEEASSTAVV